MAKGLGIIGNFRGKLGNAVGYQLKDSNNKQTQGVRVYQPVVKNPKTQAQAEQRARMAVINATYRALKSVIDRGQESVAYGNKSRLRWLSDAMKQFNGAWYEKGALVAMPALVPISKGSLPSLTYTVGNDNITIIATGVSDETPVGTIGGVSTALMNAYSFLKEGDQLTFIFVGSANGSISTRVESFVLNEASTEVTDMFTPLMSTLIVGLKQDETVGAIIVSREGEGGQHLRSNEKLDASATTKATTPYDAASKEAAIKSYMAAGSNVDWPVEDLG